MSAVILFHEGLVYDGEHLAAPCDPVDSGDGRRKRTAERMADANCLCRMESGLSHNVYVCGLCASSLDVAHALVARRALWDWESVLAIGQTAGRGQLGRSWQSETGNLFASLRLPQSPPFTGSEAAPALGALLVAALRECGYPALLKWPNDLVVPIPGGEPDGSLHKAGGILLEERGDCLVAGIGLNLVVAPPPQSLRQSHALPAGRLTRPGPDPTPLALWLHLVTRMKFWYDQSPLDDPGDFAARWRGLAERFLAWRGQQAGITDGPNDAIRLRGVISGLAPDGGLRLREGALTHTAHSGSLVRL